MLCAYLIILENDFCYSCRTYYSDLTIVYTSLEG